MNQLIESPLFPIYIIVLCASIIFFTRQQKQKQQNRFFNPMYKTIISFMASIVISAMIGALWQNMELIYYDEVQPRKVDDIIGVIISALIFLTTYFYLTAIQPVPDDKINIFLPDTKEITSLNKSYMNAHIEMQFNELIAIIKQAYNIPTDANIVIHEDHNPKELTLTGDVTLTINHIKTCFQNQLDINFTYVIKDYGKQKLIFLIDNNTENT